MFVSATLDQFDQAPFRPGIGVDIGLGLLDGAVTGQLLHVPEAAAGFEHEVRRVGDEGATPGMRRASAEPELEIELPEPVHNTAGSQTACSTTLRTNDGALGSGMPAELLQSTAQLGVERYS